MFLLAPIIAFFTSIPGAIFNLNFGAIFGGIAHFFDALFTSIRTHWQLWLVGVLIAGNLGTCWEWRHTDALLVKERAAHAADIATFKKVQADANAQAQTERATLVKEGKDSAEQADKHYASLAGQYRASLVRYAQHQGAASQPSNSKLPAPQSSDGPSASADLPATITITGSDAEICAINTARLSAVHDWAVSLPKEPTQ